MDVCHKSCCAGICFHFSFIYTGPITQLKMKPFSQTEGRTSTQDLFCLINHVSSDHLFIIRDLRRLIKLTFVIACNVVATRWRHLHTQLAQNCILFYIWCDSWQCRCAERLTILTLCIRYVHAQGHRFDSSIAKKPPSAQTCNPASFKPFQANGQKARRPTFTSEVISSHRCGYNVWACSSGCCLCS